MGKTLRPDKEKVQLQEVPRPVLEKAVEQKVRRLICPKCGTEQFAVLTRGANSYKECPGCGSRLTY